MADIAPTTKEPAAITARGFIVGSLLSLAIAIGIPYGSMVIQGSRLGLSSATPAAFFLLFVLLLTLHVFLDHSVIEVYANKTVCITGRIYPSRSDSLGIDLFAGSDGVRLRSMDTWQLASIW